jgi:uncharacterized protein
MPSAGRRDRNRESQVAPRNRRLRRYLALAILPASVLVAATAVAAWYTTSRLTAIHYVVDTYPLRILAIGAGGTNVTLSKGPDATEPGSFRMAWRGGHARVGAVVASGTGYVIRQLSDVTGHLTPGLMVGIEPNPYTGDPLTAFGIPFGTVPVPTQMGPMPAWFIAGTRSTWVILIHGLGGSRSDTLPVIPAIHSLGFPLLAITYRNDAGAPDSPDHRSHLGATEWHDAESAIAFATSHAATGVVLFGYSLGGAMAAVTAEDSPLSDHIRGLVLDSPILSWRATLNYQAARRTLPKPLIDLTASMLAWRTGLNYAQFNQLQRETSLRAPVLLIQGGADTIVPPAAAAAFARARPELVTYLRVAGADHVSAIDTDPTEYRATLTRFLSTYP